MKHLDERIISWVNLRNISRGNIYHDTTMRDKWKNASSSDWETLPWRSMVQILLELLRYVSFIKDEKVIFIYMLAAYNMFMVTGLNFMG